MASSSHATAQPTDRRLAWDGCFNVRDLGGHLTADGALTHFGAVVRSDTPDRLTDVGWSALRDHGIATVIDLRDPSEGDAGSAIPDGIERVSVPLLDLRDDEFWGDGRWRGRDHSTAFYVAVIERWPERLAEAVRRVARARPGAVLVHCQAGRDRTGLVAAALLALVGVGHESIADDYAASEASLQPLYDEWIENACDEAERDRIRRVNVADVNVMREMLASVDLPGWLVDHGLAQADVARVRERLVVRPPR